MFYTTYQGITALTSFIKKCGSPHQAMKILKRCGYDREERRKIIKGDREEVQV